MPSREESSMQEGTPLSQAQNAVDRFSNAVADAETHPDEKLLQQAHAAEEKARSAISQLQHPEHQEPVDRLHERFAEHQSRLQETESRLQ